MKLLLLARALRPGGTERQIVNIAQGLSARGVDVHIATLYPGGRLENDLSSGPQTPTLHTIGKTGRWDLAGFGWRLRRFLASRRFDVIYSFLPGPNVLALLGRTLRQRPRIVWGIRDSLLDLSLYDRFTKWVVGVESRLSPLADHVILNSRAALDTWRSGGFPEFKLSHVANGIDTRRHVPNEDARRLLREELGIPPSADLVGLVARVDPNKGHDTFLEAASLLRNHLPATRFLCVGGVTRGMDRYAAEIRRQATALDLDDSVYWLEDRSDVPDVMAALDIVTSSSGFSEGFPNAVAEGMACGVPAVVTDVGDAADIVGPNGAVVPPRDPARLAETWARTLALSTAERRALGARCRARIQESFSIDRMADETLAVLNNVLGNRGGAELAGGDSSPEEAAAKLPDRQ